MQRGPTNLREKRGGRGSWRKSIFKIEVKKLWGEIVTYEEETGDNRFCKRGFREELGKGTRSYQDTG